MHSGPVPLIVYCGPVPLMYCGPVPLVTYICVWCLQKVQRKTKRTSGEGESGDEDDDGSGKVKGQKGRRRRGAGGEGDDDVSTAQCGLASCNAGSLY